MLKPFEKLPPIACNDAGREVLKCAVWINESYWALWHFIQLAAPAYTSPRGSVGLLLKHCVKINVNGMSDIKTKKSVLFLSIGLLLAV
jgi:hypothetical protein